MEVRELIKKQTNTIPPLEREARIKEMRKEDEKLRKGMFEFVDAQGGWIQFAYRKYPGEPIQMIRIDHGAIETIPMGLVKHLNNTKRKVRRYSSELPSHGGRAPRTFEVISRVRFTPMDVL